MASRRRRRERRRRRSSSRRRRRASDPPPARNHGERRHPPCVPARSLSRRSGPWPPLLAVRCAAAVDSSGSFCSLCSGRLLVRRVVWIRGLLGRRGWLRSVPARLLVNRLSGRCQLMGIRFTCLVTCVVDGVLQHLIGVFGELNAWAVDYRSVSSFSSLGLPHDLSC